MLKLTFIFLVGIAYAAQTRIKIGSQSWGYQIELNQGQNIRTEFADEDGVASGYYLYKTGNETKKLEYRIDPNRMEPDISFNVVNIEETRPTATEAPPVGTEGGGGGGGESGNTTLSSNSTETADTELISSKVGASNMTFDSIDSKQDFKGHVTLKVGNSTYTINFVTGDRSHTREESLQPNGMMFGRFSYLLKSSPNKLVINYKFNSTSPDPTFEVSLYKTIESETPSPSQSNGNYQPITTPRENYSRQVSYPARNIADRYNAIGASLPSSPVSTSIRGAHYPTRELAEKYRDRSPQSQGAVPPSWYYNRGKPVYDP